MKVLLCGEGPHDVGQIQCWSINPAKEVSQRGWLQPLIEKALGRKDIEFVIVPRSRLISLPKGGEQKQKLDGHAQKAAIAKFRAITDKCDLLVFMVDADSNNKIEWRKKRKEILAGFAHLDHDISCVACVPMSASESWLLSDGNAWESMGLPDPNVLPKKPEKIWGTRNDPASNHPKQHFRRTCALAGIHDDCSTREVLMDRSDLAILRERCPTSLEAFVEDLAA